MVAARTLGRGDDDFAEAAVRLALVDPRITNGQVRYSADLLHPELGRRCWLGT